MSRGLQSCSWSRSQRRPGSLYIRPWRLENQINLNGWTIYAATYVATSEWCFMCLPLKDIALGSSRRGGSYAILGVLAINQLPWWEPKVYIICCGPFTWSTITLHLSWGLSIAILGFEIFPWYNLWMIFNALYIFTVMVLALSLKYNPWGIIVGHFHLQRPFRWLDYTMNCPYGWQLSKCTCCHTQR